MNTKIKRRLAAVSAAIVIVVVLLLAFVGSKTSSKTVSVAEAVSGAYTDTDQKIQVSGVVEDNSAVLTEEGIDFSICDAEDAEATSLRVRYNGTVSSTFGNGVSALCTGRIDSDGVLVANTMLTKCPSKYESAACAIGVAELLDYGDALIDVTVRVQGFVKEGTLVPAGSGERFVLEDVGRADEQAEQDIQAPSISVVYDGALPEGIQAESRLLITGSVGEDGTFHTTNVSIAK